MLLQKADSRVYSHYHPATFTHTLSQTHTHHSLTVPYIGIYEVAVCDFYPSPERDFFSEKSVAISVQYYFDCVVNVICGENMNTKVWLCLPLAIILLIHPPFLYKEKKINFHFRRSFTSNFTNKCELLDATSSDDVAPLEWGILFSFKCDGNKTLKLRYLQLHFLLILLPLFFWDVGYTVLIICISLFTDILTKPRRGPSLVHEWFNMSLQPVFLSGNLKLVKRMGFQQFLKVFPSPSHPFTLSFGTADGGPVSICRLTLNESMQLWGFCPELGFQVFVNKPPFRIISAK